MTPVSWIQSAVLSNYRCFPELSVTFDRYMTVLVADNGGGKTTVLDAVSVALSAFTGAFYNGKRLGIHKEDVRLKVMSQAILQMEPQYPCVLACQGVVNDASVSWQRRMNTPNSYNTYKEANDLIAIGSDLQEAVSDDDRAPVMLPVLAYYGTARLWSQKKITGKKSFEAEFYSRTSGYLDCLDPASSYKYFVDWFRFTSKAHRDLREQNEQRYGDPGLSMPTPYGDLLEGVRQTVGICLENSGWGNLRFSSIHDAPVVEHPEQGVLEVSQLSDGLRNMVALVADLAYRAIRLNSHLGADAPRQSSGIVLIDEVDMHLHPQWQQSVLVQLRQAFPEMQFIVTTHSPQVLSTVPREQIRQLSQNTEGGYIAAIPVAESYGRSNADVLQGVMHVDPVPEFEEQILLEEYRTLAEQGDINDPRLDQLAQQLSEILGGDHPDLVRLSMVRRRRSVLG